MKDTSEPSAEPMDHSSLKRASVRGAALTLVSQSARFGLIFGAQLILARLLSPAQFGLVAMAAPVLSLVQVFNDLGLSQATVQRPAITDGELTALFWINVSVSAVLSALVVLTAPWVALFYGQPQLTTVVAALGGLLVLSGAGAQQIALLNRYMKYSELAVIDVSSAVVGVGAGIWAALAGLGIWSLVLMQAANSATILVLSWSLSGWRPTWPRRGTDVTPLLRMGGHLTGYNVLTYIESNLSTVLIGRLDGSVSVGLYDRAFRLVIVPWWQISLPVDRVAVSLLSRLTGSTTDYVRAHRQMLQGLLLLTGPGLIWATTQSDTLIPLLLGSAWSQAAPIFAWLSVSAVAFPYGAGAYWLFVTQDRARAQLHYGFAGAAALVVSVIAGIHWGPVGVARAYAGFTPLIVGLPLWGATRRGPVSFYDIVRSTAPILLGFVVASMAEILGRPWIPSVRNASVSLIALLLLSYASCLVGLCMQSKGRRILADTWALRRAFRR